MSVTIRDVAEKAGVSVTTVSRTLNNRGYISQKTRNKISAAIQELNYSPNQLARSLFNARTQTIGLVVPSICHPFFSQVTQLLEQRLYHLGYHILMCTTEGNPGQESHIFDILRQSRVDGIIIGSPCLSDQKYANIGIPIVSFDTHMLGASVSVAANHDLGGRIAARALLAGGCRRVLQIVGDLSAKTDAVKRHRSFMEEMMAADCECISLPMVNNFTDLRSSRSVIESIFDLYPDIDACFATDLCAAEIVHCALTRRISIPGKLQVIGYDGTDAVAVMCPLLTVIRQPYEELTDRIVESMMELLNGGTPEPQIVLDHLTLVPGITTRNAGINQ